jgi:hypothetical protein
MNVRIAVVIPTRNRPELALDAVRSLMNQAAAIEIFISDNCSEPSEDLSALARSNSAVRYLRPARELSMTDHWDWALQQAMSASGASHFTIHYDRRYSYPDAWTQLATVCAGHPDLVVTYSVDSVADDPPPLRLWQTPWTGEVFEIETARVAVLVARGQVADAHQAIPILSNALVPRAILQRVIDTFGSICVSTVADACFASRLLAVEQRFLHVDRPVGVNYAPHRSSAMGFLRGGGGEYEDWRRTLGERPWLDASPVPGVSVGQNMFFHEYELVRRVTRDRLPPLDPRGVLQHLGAELRWVRVPAVRAELRKVLAAQGWEGDVTELPQRPAAAKVRQAFLQFLMARARYRPASISGFAFDSDSDALAYALRYPRARQTSARHLELLDPRRVERCGAGDHK